jgi:hypothetical protein
MESAEWKNKAREEGEKKKRTRRPSEMMVRGFAGR